MQCMGDLCYYDVLIGEDLDIIRICCNINIMDFVVEIGDVRRTAAILFSVITIYLKGNSLTYSFVIYKKLLVLF